MEAVVDPGRLLVAVTTGTSHGDGWRESKLALMKAAVSGSKLPRF